MKPFQIVSFLVAIVSLSQLSLGRVSNYVVDVSLDESGNSAVKIFITFERLETYFKFFFPFKISGLDHSTTGNWIDCKLTQNEVSEIECWFELKEDGKSIRLNFESLDLVSKLNETYYFMGDFSIWENINESSVVVRLPEGFILLGEEKIHPQDATTTSDGRRIIVIWDRKDVSSTQSLKFQLAYESTLKEFVIPWHIIFIISLIVIFAFVFIWRRVRKPEEVILSVLDEYERKIVELIKTAGEIKQKRIVQRTNLSKAKVSRVIKSLQERGLIEVRRIGRTNLIRIAKKKIGIFRK